MSWVDCSCWTMDGDEEIMVGVVRMAYPPGIGQTMIFKHPAPDDDTIEERGQRDIGKHRLWKVKDVRHGVDQYAPSVHHEVEVLLTPIQEVDK